EPLLGEDEHLGWLVRDKHGHLDAVPMAIRAAKRKAGWTGKRLAWNRIHMAEPHDLEAADAVVVQLIHDQGTANTNHHYDSLARDVAVLDRLVGHPRVFRRDGGLKRIEVKRTTARLSLDSTEDGNIKIEAKLGDLPLDFADLKRYVLDTSASGRAAWWTPEHDVLVVRIPEALPRLVRALKGRRTELPASAREALIERLPSLATKVDLAVAEDLRGWALEATDRPVCRLTLHGDDDASVLMVALAVRPVEGGQLYPPGDGPELIFGSRDGATVHAKRDLRAEVRAAEALVDTLGLGSALPIGPYTWRYQGADDALRLVSDLQSKPELIEVQWADERPRKVSRTATSSDLRINLTERGAWFKVDGKLTVDGVTVPLGTLLEAVRAKKRFVSVDASTWVRIGQTLADQLAGIAGVTYGSKKALQVSRAASPILAELDASEVPVDTPPTWVTMLANLRQSEIVAPPLPANFKGVLRDYQRVGFEWLSRLSLWSPGACLADDMGLGKTIQGLALLLQRSDAGPQLVVAPTSVGFNWVREAERFAPSLRIKTLRGKADMGDVEHAAPGDLYVTSYEVVQRHDAVFSEVHWQTMVLDEAQAIKNPTTKRAQAIRSLDRAFTLALTGTPIENRTGELWSLFEALTPGLLGTKTQFRARYAIPIEKHGEAEARAELSRLVRPFILRRMKSEVAQELPPRTDIQHDVVLSDGEQKLYDQVRNAAIRSLEKKPKTGSVDGKGHPQQKRFQVLAALTRLRQLACHPRLFDPDSTEPSSKLRALRELVSELRAEGHRALIFSQFTSHLALVREALTEDGATMCYLDGSTPTAERRRQVDRFQAGDADVFLLSVKAGGTGLNLTAANYVIHIDPWWNPAVEDQATDRAHRIGQEQPVTVIRLVTSQTIEANILALHDRKRRLVAELLDGTGDAGVLSTDELFTLISDFA
ncbi:MAG: superfamily II DNA or RNA helicase, partial [Myxococcota bacterium]